MVLKGNSTIWKVTGIQIRSTPLKHTVPPRPGFYHTCAVEPIVDGLVSPGEVFHLTPPELNNT